MLFVRNSRITRARLHAFIFSALFCSGVLGWFWGVRAPIVAMINNHKEALIVRAVLQSQNVHSGTRMRIDSERRDAADLLIDFVSDIADSSLELLSFVHHEIQDKTRWTKIIMNIRLMGSFEELVKLFDKFSTHQYMIRYKKIVMDRDGGAASSIVDFDVCIYIPK